MDARGQFALGHRVDHHANSLFEAALPARLVGVADEKGVGGQPRGHQHDLGKTLKLGPVGGDADQRAQLLGQIALEIGLQLGRDGMDPERGEGRARRQQRADHRRLAGQHNGHGSGQHGLVGTLFGRASAHGQVECRGQFGEDDFAQRGVGLNQQPSRGRRKLKPSGHARAHEFFVGSQAARADHQVADQLVDHHFGGHLGRERGGGARGAHIDAAAVADLKPALVFEFFVGRAGGVGMDAVALGQLAGAGQPLAGGKLAAQDAQNDLGRELLAQVNVAVPLKPEAHGYLLDFGTGIRIPAGAGYCSDRP